MRKEIQRDFLGGVFQGREKAFAEAGDIRIIKPRRSIPIRAAAVLLIWEPRNSCG